jgi:hypothetical protein
VTDSVPADQGQGSSAINLSSPLDGVADMRSTAKWTITALGAIGVALLGGGPLSAVGKIHGIGQAAEAFAGLVIALAGIGWAIWFTTEALMPPVTTLASIAEPELAGLRAQIAADPGAFFGPFGNSVDQLKNQCTFWQATAAQTSITLAIEQDDKLKRMLTQALSDAEANAAQAAARLRWLLDFTHAWRVRDKLRRARVHAFCGAAVTALGAVTFVAATTRLSRGTFRGKLWTLTKPDLAPFKPSPITWRGW